MKKNTVLVIASHPDDEVLGVGGTILNYSSRGHSVDVLFLSSGVGSRDNEREDRISRISSAQAALKLLGCRETIHGDFPDNAFDSVGILKVAKFIETQIERLRPTIIFTNFHGDLNVDHRITAEATLIASRPKSNSYVNELYFYEVLSSTGWKFGSELFRPNYFSDISSTIDKKLLALDAYGVEIDVPPNARSLESARALAQTRGNFIGVNFAEAFEVGFIRVKE